MYIFLWVRKNAFHICFAWLRKQWFMFAIVTKYVNSDGVCFETPCSRVARFFLVQHTKTGKNVPNNHKIYQMATKHTKWPLNIPATSLQVPPKYTQIRIF
jgi:hypothetical protein